MSDTHTSKEFLFQIETTDRFIFDSRTLCFREMVPSVNMMKDETGYRFYKADRVGYFGALGIVFSDEPEFDKYCRLIRDVSDIASQVMGYPFISGAFVKGKRIEIVDVSTKDSGPFGQLMQVCVYQVCLKVVFVSDSEWFIRNVDQLTT